MSILAIEGTVEHGHIRLPDGVILPEGARVFVVVPEVQAVPQARVYSPRLRRPEQAADFVKEVIEAPSNEQV
jgi:hypothetical protein